MVPSGTYTWPAPETPPGPMLQKHHIAIDHMSRDCGDQQLSYPHATMPTGWELRTQLGHAWILSLQAIAYSCVIWGNTLTPNYTQELPRNPELDSGAAPPIPWAHLTIYSQTPGSLS